LAAVRRPACEFGPPNLARFAFVSGTGSMAVTRVVALAFWPEVVADIALVSVAAPVAGSVAEAPAPVPVAAPADEPLIEPDMPDWPVSPAALGAAVLEGSLTAPLGEVVELDCAKAAPAISPEAATAPNRWINFISQLSL
jgi:hypothetical protein